MVSSVVLMPFSMSMECLRPPSGWGVLHAHTTEAWERVDSSCNSRRALTRRMPPSANRRQWNLWEVDDGEVTWCTGPRHRSPGEWRQIGRSISINKRAWLGSCHRDSYLQANDGNRGAQSYLAKSTEKRLGHDCNVPVIKDWGRERVKNNLK